MGQEGESMKGVEGGEGYRCGEGKIEGVRAHSTLKHGLVIKDGEMD